LHGARRRATPLPTLLSPARQPRFPSSGRCTYTAGLDAEGLDLQFGPGGEAYALLTNHTLTLHAAAGGGGLLARVDSDEVKFTALARQRQDER
jgi:hypothetical protein